jgi:hypothetical protein
MPENPAQVSGTFQNLETPLRLAFSTAPTIFCPRMSYVSSAFFWQNFWPNFFADFFATLIVGIGIT